MKPFQSSKVLSLALSISVLVGVQADSFAAYLNDINGHWAQQQIQTLNNKNVIGGYPDGSFNPEGTITRAELSAVLVKALNLPSMNANSSSFNDVPATHWASPSIEAVKKAGLVNGYPGGLFMPNKPVSRLEAMAILSNANPAAFPSDSETGVILNRFIDGNDVPNWGAKAVAESVATGIFVNKPGNQNHVEPNRSASRGEVAAMVSNLLNKSGADKTVASNNNMNNQSQTAYQTQQQGTDEQPLKARLVTIPAQTEFTGTVKTPISSELANVGDEVKLTIDQALMSEGNIVVIPNGSEIMGTVDEVNPTKRLGRAATMSIRFKEIVAPDGQRIPIQGRVATESGMLEAGSTKGRILSAAGKTAVGAGLGAALGTAIAPLSGGKLGKGAIFGTAVGATAGAIASGASKGKELVIPSGQQLKIRLEEPIQMTAK